MKRFAVLAFTAMTAIAPLAATPASAAPHYNTAPQNSPRAEHREDRRDERRDERRDDRRDVRQQQRWDGRQHNGYTYNGRWNYGAPPAAYYRRPDFQPGYHA